MRKVGAGNVPGTLGRINATKPLAVVEVTATTVSMRLRPFSSGAKPLHLTFEELKRVYLVRRFGMGMGVAFTDPDGHDYYFWCRRPWELIRELRSVGIAISDNVEPATKVWEGGL